jgi:cell division protein FtsB
MSRSSARRSAADSAPEPSTSGIAAGQAQTDAEPPAPVTAKPAAAAALGSLSDLPVAGLTRRRIGLLVAAVVAAWVIVLFARQVSDAAEAASMADAMRARNAALQADVNALEREKYLIEKQAYIEQQARAYRLGTTREIPFILADDAPPLPPDAPGSASAKLGAVVVQRTPLEHWLDLLFGPGDGATAPG